MTPTDDFALDSATQNRLGRLVAMDPATIQGVARRLLDRGLVARAQDPMDRRTAVLTPTADGRALIEAGTPCAQRAHDAALSPLDPQERVHFLSLLRKMG